MPPPGLTSGSALLWVTPLHKAVALQAFPFPERLHVEDDGCLNLSEQQYQVTGATQVGQTDLPLKGERPGVFRVLCAQTMGRNRDEKDARGSDQQLDTPGPLKDTSHYGSSRTTDLLPDTPGCIWTNRQLPAVSGALAQLGTN